MNYRFFIHKLFYLLWFVLIPMTVAWVAVDILDRARVVDEFEPWYVLALFAFLVIVAYSLRDRLPLWRDRDENSPFNRSRRTKAARSLLARVRKIMDKKGYKISDRGKTELNSALSALDRLVEEDIHEKIPGAMTKLEDKANRHMPFARKSAAREYFESIGVAVLVAVLLRLFVLEAFKIPSESMVPTLMVGDHIFVSKYLYGISLPFNNKRLVRFASPSYGEVIVFVKPSKEEQTGIPSTPDERFLDEANKSGTDFIKRIVALPGDVVEVKKDVLFINGEEIPRCRVGTRTYRSRDEFTGVWEDEERQLWLERHGDYVYTIVEHEGDMSDFGPYKVPDDQVFVMGDNRDNSLDSRSWGSVPFDNIKGRAGIIWWSNRRPHGFEWERFGDLIMNAPDLTPEQEAAARACGILP